MLGSQAKIERATKSTQLIFRIWVSCFALGFLGYAIFELVKNPFAYIVSAQYNFYFGHTKILLVFIPLFLYYLWRFNPIFSFAYAGMLYCFHELVFNLLFSVYWHTWNLSNRIGYIEITVTLFIYILRFYRPNKYALISFLIFGSMMLIWILGFQFIVTSNSTLSITENIANSTKLIPNLFESLYNLTFGIFFLFFVRITKSQKSVLL